MECELLEIVGGQPRADLVRTNTAPPDAREGSIGAEFRAKPLAFPLQFRMFLVLDSGSIPYRDRDRGRDRNRTVGVP